MESTKKREDMEKVQGEPPMVDFKTKKQQYRLMLKDAKAEAVSNLIIECASDIEKLYHIIYNMMGKHSIKTLTRF